jgi:hypothetical protein
MPGVFLYCSTVISSPECTHHYYLKSVWERVIGTGRIKLSERRPMQPV